MHHTATTTTKKILQGGLLWHKIDYPCKWTSLFSPFYNLVSLLFLHRPIQCQKITKKSDLAAHEIKKIFFCNSEWIFMDNYRRGRKRVLLHENNDLYSLILCVSGLQLLCALFFFWMCVVGWEKKMFILAELWWITLVIFSQRGEERGWLF